MTRSCSCPRSSRLAVLALVAAAACHGDGDEPVRVVGRSVLDVVQARVRVPELPLDVDAWQARAADLRERLWVATRLPRPRPALTAIPLGSRIVDGVRIDELLLPGYDGMTVPVTMYLPVDAPRPLPAVVLCGGHDADGQRAFYLRALAWRLAKNGVAAVSYDWLGMGSRFRPEQRHVPVGLRSIFAGLQPVAPLLDEPLRVWEHAAAHAEIDPARVAVAGHSGGAMVAMHLAALEPRVAAAVVVDLPVPVDYLFGELAGRWGDPDSMVPGAAAFASHEELLALIAPRPLLVMSGDADVIAPTRAVTTLMAFPRAVYGLLGAAPEHQGFPTAHCWCDGKLPATIGFLGLALTGAAIASTLTPPDAAVPQAAPRASDPIWLGLVEARYRVDPPAPASADEARAQRAAIDARLAAVVEADRGAGFALEGTRDTAIVLVGGRDLERDGVVRLVPAGLELVDESEDDQRYRTQNALAVGTSVLALGLGDVVDLTTELRRRRTRRIVAICDGEQAVLLCLVAADRFDGLVLRGLPEHHAAHFVLGAPPPLLYWATPGLATLSVGELVARAAPRPLAVVEPAGDAPAFWALEGGCLAWGAADVEAGLDAVLACQDFL